MSQIIKSYYIHCPIKARSIKPSIAILLVCLCVLFSGCNRQEKYSPHTLRIGVAVYLQSDTFISTLLQNLERLAQQQEEKESIKINLNILDAHGSQIVQNEQIDRLIGLNYDVLCVNIVDRTSAALLIDKAKEADIPIIFFNREPVQEDILRWEKVYYVGARAEDSGVLQGEMILNYWQKDSDKLDKNGDGVLQYVMLEGEPGHQDTLLRTEYSVQTLIEGGLTVEKLASNTANWDRSQAHARMSQWIQELPVLPEIIISNNDDMALGAIDALLQAEVSPDQMPMTVGVDSTPAALDAIRQGTMYGTVLNDAQGIAEEILRLATGLQKKDFSTQQQKDQYIWLPYTAVTCENLTQ